MAASSNPAVLQGTTPSGDDVLFTTTASLVVGESDGGYENVFDARVGGGFPEEAGVPSCVGQGCRAAFGAAPVFAAPGSTSLQGSGNLPAPAAAVKPKAKSKPVSCRRGFVRKRVKGRSVCVKKRAKGGERGHGK